MQRPNQSHSGCLETEVPRATHIKVVLSYRHWVSKADRLRYTYQIVSLSVRLGLVTLEVLVLGGPPNAGPILNERLLSPNEAAQNATERTVLAATGRFWVSSTGSVRPQSPQSAAAAPAFLRRAYSSCARPQPTAANNPCWAVRLGLGAIFSVPGVLGPSMCTAQGVVAQSATDFTMGNLVPIMSLMPLLASSTAAILATRSESFGTRRLALTSSVVYPLGCYMLPAIAVKANSLSGFAASYVIVGGLGFYAGYPQVPPFLMKWFPTRSG